MDRRLSGALAWGALLLIVGIPGFDMLSRSDSETAGVAASPEDGGTGLSWQSGSAPVDTDTSAFGPLPQAAATDVPEASDAGEDDSLPSVTLLASAPDAAAAEAPPAAPSPSIITIDDSFAPVEPTELDTLDIDAVIADVTTGAETPEPAPEPEPTAAASADSVSSAIAARVRDVLFSSPDAEIAPDSAAEPEDFTDIGLGTASQPLGDSAGTVPDDDLAAVATAPLVFSTPVSVAPETIPYPAPALRRLSPPVARTTLVPPEPVPEIRPDNAIFFGDWVNTAPTSTATGPGR